MKKIFVGILVSTLASLSAQAEIPYIFGASSDCTEYIQAVANLRYHESDEKDLYIPFAQALHKYNSTIEDLAGNPDLSPNVKEAMTNAFKDAVNARLIAINGWYPKIAEEINLTCQVDSPEINALMVDPMSLPINQY